jgi:hypothetical protein
MVKSREGLASFVAIVKAGGDGRWAMVDPALRCPADKPPTRAGGMVGIGVDMAFIRYRRRWPRIGLSPRDHDAPAAEDGAVARISRIVQFSQADPLKCEGDQTLIRLTVDGMTRGGKGMREFHRYGGTAFQQIPRHQTFQEGDDPNLEIRNLGIINRYTQFLRRYFAVGDKRVDVQLEQVFTLLVGAGQLKAAGQAAGPSMSRFRFGPAVFPEQMTVPILPKSRSRTLKNRCSLRNPEHNSRRYHGRGFEKLVTTKLCSHTLQFHYRKSSHRKYSRIISSGRQSWIEKCVPSMRYARKVKDKERSRKSLSLIACFPPIIETAVGVLARAGEFPASDRF